MTELSLFTGAGGGVLGSILAGIETIGYVEWEPYPCAVLQQRMDDGCIPVAPIFNCDLREFIRSGLAQLFEGVDIVSAGFPCQPFSVAGQRRGDADERNGWPWTISAIRKVRPKMCLLENVPGLVANPYFGRILGDLAEAGYDAEWGCVSAADVGAPHKRNRLWIVAHAQGREDHGREQRDVGETAEGREGLDTAVVAGGEVAHRDDKRESQQEGIIKDIGRRPLDRREAIGDAERGGLGGEPRRGPGPEPADGHLQPETWWGRDPADLPVTVSWEQYRGRGARDRADGGSEKPGEIKAGRERRPDDWGLESGLGRVADGVAYRVDRLKAIGNGQVPAVVRAAWEMMAGKYRIEG